MEPLLGGFFETKPNIPFFLRNQKREQLSNKEAASLLSLKRWSPRFACFQRKHAQASETGPIL